MSHGVKKNTVLFKVAIGRREGKEVSWIFKTEEGVWGSYMNCCGCKELSQYCISLGEGYFDEQFYCKKCKNASVCFPYDDEMNMIQKIITEFKCFIHKYTRW